jgi:hypothetical protein
MSGAMLTDRAHALMHCLRRRPQDYVVPILTSAAIGFVVYLVLTRKLFPSIELALLELSPIATAFAQAPNWSGHEQLRAITIAFIAFFVCVALLVFAEASSFSSNADTRKRSMDIVENVLTFFCGIIAGYFGGAI